MKRDYFKKTFLLLAILLTHLPFLQAKDWSDIVKKRVIKDVQPLCEEDIYKTGNGTSPLMKKVMAAVQKVKDKGTVRDDLLFTKGYADLKVYRGGDEIFKKVAKMIVKAEKEVLIQTMIFDMNSRSADLVYDAIVKLERKRKRMKAKTPVVVRFLFDIMGTRKGFNIFELLTWGVFGGRTESLRANKNYQIEFPKRLDPKYIRFEIKGHRHSSLIAVSHSKTIVVDRNIGMVMGANFIDYHHTSEKKTPMGTDLMVDHGFVVYGEPAFMLADDFYHLWHKNKGKIQGFTSQYNGNVDADVMYKWDGKAFPKKKMNTVIQYLKGKRIIGPILVGSVGRTAEGRRRVKAATINPQNAAFEAVLKHAKSHINIVSPSLNSVEFMELIIDTLGRGVDVNFLLSKNYQDYNKFYQQGGTNSDAVRWIRKKLKRLVSKRTKTSVNMILELQENMVRQEAKKPKNKRKKIGDFNLTWFVTRGGNISGKEKGKRYKYSTRFREKFWNHNHTKFLSADNQVTIVGTANIDEQSWYNSRETNIVIDHHKLTKSWCTKIFKTDFMRGRQWGRKFWEGEACWFNSQCRSNLCNNNLFKGFTWKCVFQKKKGLAGGYCDRDWQCKSTDCNPRIKECN